MLALSGSLALPGCGDLESGAPVELRSEDPVASFHLNTRLPTFGEMVKEWGTASGLQGLTSEWQSSWELEAAQGTRARREAVEAGAAILAPSIPRSALDQGLREVDEALRGAEAALGAALTEHPDLTAPLVEAARHRDLAREARDAGDSEALLRHTLLASDLILSTTAEPLALLFIERARAELRRLSADDPYPSVTRERAERLLVGAREALDTGEPALALQRAWYAVGLLRSTERLDLPPGTPDPDPGLPREPELQETR
jgi:hypothetical protein